MKLHKILQALTFLNCSVILQSSVLAQSEQELFFQEQNSFNKNGNSNSQIIADTQLNLINFPLLNQQDELFLSLKNDKERLNLMELPSEIIGYDLEHYIHYWRLQQNLTQGITTGIPEFLARFPNTYPAENLRRQWLVHLAKKGQWDLYEKEVSLLFANDEPESQSLKQLLKSDVKELWKLANQGKSSSEAQILWNSLALRVSEKTIVYHRLFTWLENGQNTAANQLSWALGENLNDSSAVGQTAQLIKLAKTDLNRAIVQASTISLAKPFDGYVWGYIAMLLAKKQAPEASIYFEKSGNWLSDEAWQWKTRTYLKNLDWQNVQKTILAMPQHLREESTWNYWLGKSYAMLNQKEVAQDIWNQFLTRFPQGVDFYRILMKEELGLDLSTTFAQRTNSSGSVPKTIQRALKWYQLGFKQEGLQEWIYALKTLNDEELLAAGKIAMQYGLFDRGINTSEKTKQNHNFALRYPIIYGDLVKRYSTLKNVEPSWIFAFIRQESRFMKEARSGVGAGGLMQLMPATAREMARKNNLMNYSVHIPQDNIILGTTYIAQVAKSFGGASIERTGSGTQPLTTAAYNAGPGRPAKWRNLFNQPVEGAIFAEIIPFQETRDYVKKVLLNATVYSYLLQKPVSLKERLGYVSPNRTYQSNEE